MEMTHSSFGSNTGLQQNQELLLCLLYPQDSHCHADNVPEGRRASAFGILSGIGSCAFVCGTLSTRFLSTASTFQVSTAMAMLSAVYMRVFLPDSIINDNLSTPIISEGKSDDVANQNEEPGKKMQVFKTMPSMEDMLALLKSSNLADVGLHASLLLLLMPILAPALGEERLLSVGLFFSSAHMIFYSIAWSFWIRSIVSKQIGPCEQGKAQGIISGIGSFANVASPLAFSPLTALFLSERAPFYFPGFSIMCVGFASMIAFVQSLMIRAIPPISSQRVGNCNYMETA
ncbi:DNA replication and repair recF [Gossypium arboreum]|uniref:DNA replication and repair recF n=1 Tax=Gossypium arboreum TaxID=29729 RepID=A0A0B0NLR4_GOSAR|nr:DNA replication and repair recF [Gossypium arboreum]